MRLKYNRENLGIVYRNATKKLILKKEMNFNENYF